MSFDLDFNRPFEYEIDKPQEAEMKPIPYFKPYIVEFSGQLADETKRAYLTNIRQFFSVDNIYEITVDMVRSVTPAQVNRYAKKLILDGQTPATVNRKLQAVSKFYKFLCRKSVGIMDYNPISTDEGTMRFKSKNYSNTRALTTDEVKKMLKTLNDDDSILGKRNRIIILLLATTGMRREEIANIKIGYFSTYKGEYVLEFTGKGAKDRIVVVADVVMKYIKEYLELRDLTMMDKDEYLFASHSVVKPNPRLENKNRKSKPITTQTVYRVVKKVAKDAGLDESDISPHCLRHTYITQSIEADIPLEDIQDRVGHVSSSTTRRYDHTFRIVKNNPANMFAEELEDGVDEEC